MAHKKSLAHQRAAIVGAGVIGSSWAALFLAHGLRVTVYDPRPDVESRVRASLRQAAPALKSLGLRPQILPGVEVRAGTAEGQAACATSWSTSVRRSSVCGKCWGRSRFDRPTVELLSA